MLNILSRDSIFFDGYLPPRKQPVRHNRLDQSLKELTLFHATHIGGFEPLQQTNLTRLSCNERVFNPARKVPVSLRGAPAPPFLVPAVLEAVRGSIYAGVATLVPGEADGYCAQAARERGSMILTTDSDVLVYDLGPGAVAFLSEVQLIGGNLDSCETLKAAVWRPEAISRKLGLPGLARLAFEISRDRHLTMQEAIRRAKNPFENADDFEHFMDEYRANPVLAELLVFENDHLDLFKSHGQSLDHRVAELILQAGGIDGPEKICMFLPFLVDDPSKSTAWAPSSHVRALAYSCLIQFYRQMNNSLGLIVYEYARKGSRFVPELSNIDHRMESLYSQASDLVAQFAETRSRYQQYPPHISLWWRVFAIKLIYRWYLDSSKTPPSRATIKRVLSGSRASRWAWEDVHLSAHIQGVLYSWRILAQIVQYINGCDKTPLTKILAELSVTLLNLSDLREMMLSNAQIAREMDEFDVDAQVNNLLESLRLKTGQSEMEGGKRAVVGEPKESTASKRAEKKKSQGKKRQALEKDQKPAANNMYAILVEEGK